MDIFYNMGVSGERGVVRAYDGLHDLIQGLLSLEIDLGDDFPFEFPDLRVEDHCACRIDILVGVSELGLVMVLSDCDMVDLEASEALVPLRGVEGGRVVEEPVE